jgi:hypothetical protein
MTIANVKMANRAILAPHVDVIALDTKPPPQLLTRWDAKLAFATAGASTNRIKGWPTNKMILVA